MRTQPRTARHVRPCGAFGGRLASRLGLLPFAALLRRLGGLFGCLPRPFGWRVTVTSIQSLW